MRYGLRSAVLWTGLLLTTASRAMFCDLLFDGGFEDAAVAAPGTLMADAGADITALPGDTVQLDGSASVAPRPGPLSYCWHLTGSAGDTDAALSDPRAIAPTLTVHRAGRYQARLLVSDGVDESLPATVVIDTTAVSLEVDASGDTIVASDGQMALTIPPGALDQSTTVTIRELARDDLNPSFRDLPVAAAYELSPDGTQFNQPATLTWQLDDADDTPLAALLVSAGGTEVLDVEAQLNGLLTGEISHFSRLLVLRLAQLRFETPPVTAMVGATFNASYFATFSAGPDGASAATRKEGIYAQSPRIISPLFLLNPAVEDLAYGDDLNASLPAMPSDSGTISGRCARAGQVSLGVQVATSGNLLTFILSTLNGTPGVTTLQIPVTCQDNSNAPIAADDQVTLPLGTTASNIAVLANDVDLDGTLDPATVRLLRAPFAGAVAFDPGTGLATYTSNARLAIIIRNDSFTYVVDDNDGLTSNPATVFIRRSSASNMAPVANDDMATVDAGQSVTVAILANDSDTDGFLDPATLQQRSNPSGGIIAFNAGGTVTYTANAQFNGVDRIRYRVSDDDGAVSNEAEIVLTVGNSTQIVTFDDQVDASTEVPIEIDVLANDVGPFDPSTLNIIQSTFRGTASVGIGMAGHEVIMYTSFPGSVGMDSLLYQVGDGGANLSNLAQLSINLTNPNNQPPIAVDDQVETDLDTPVEVFVYMNDDDPDGLLTVSVPEVVTNATNGTATAQFGSILYTPNQGFSGFDQFTYRIFDDNNAASNVAAVMVNVTFDNDPPLARDDLASVAMDGSITINLTGNDEDPNGNLDPTSVAIVMPPVNGVATIEVDGRLSYTPDAGFTGTDTLTYTVSDLLAEVSNVATVTITVADFAGSDASPLDNISVAQLNFFAIYNDAFMSQGQGSFLGFFHADQAALDGLTQIADHTWIFQIPQATEVGSDDEFTFMTDLQQGTATYTPSRGVYVFEGFNPGPLFNDVDGNLTVTAMDSDPTANITAPPPVVDSLGQPTMFRGAFTGLSTEVQFPDGQFTHFLARYIVRLNNQFGFGGVIVRAPADSMMLDQATGMRFRPILDATAIAALEARGAEALSGVAFVFYNQRDETAFFPGMDQRPVPIAAGRGVSVPAAQLNDPIDFCANRPAGTLCEGGPREVLLANRLGGEVTMHSPVDGAFLGSLIGGNAPNFTVSSGWQIVQDPNNNCLLFSDSGNDAIHQYDTDGSLVQSRFIDTMDAGGPGGDVLGDPRGMAFLDGDLLVAANTQGRVLRFDSDGNFIEEIVSGAGRPNGLFVQPNGDIILSDESGAPLEDRVLKFAADDRATAVEIISANISTPHQISRLLDGNLALASFATREIRVFEDGFPTIAGITLPNTASDDTRNPLGIFPLQNGNWLFTADAATGVATIDPRNPDTSINTIEIGNDFRYISRACLPE